MNRVVALAPAYPPLSGEPARAAPLEIVTTVLPGSSGNSSASRTQWNTWRTSTSQLRLNVSHVWCWIGRINGAAPALRTSVWGRYCSTRVAAASHGHDVGSLGVQRRGDGPAEAPAGPCHQGR